MEKLLTIVVPTYNTEQYLEKCIKSVINDDYIRKIEILIVIDGSPDNSIVIAKSFAEKYPNSIFVINKDNGGHGSTINCGLLKSTGKYFRILDSDDWLDQENFSKYLAILEKSNEDIILTHVAKEYVYENTVIVDQIPDFEYNYVYDLDKSDSSKLPMNLFSMARCTYKTELLKNSELSLLENTLFEDTYLHIFPFIFLKKFIFYDFVLYHYLIGRPGQSVSKELLRRNHNHWYKVIDQMVGFYAKNCNSFSTNNEKYVLDELKYYVSQMYYKINHLKYFDSKIELKKWNMYVENLPFASKITDYRKTLYTRLPYIIFRFLYFIRLWMYTRFGVQSQKRS